MKMEALYSSETLVLYYTTMCHDKNYHSTIEKAGSISNGPDLHSDVYVKLHSEEYLLLGYDAV
jgi:hypothetical protein